ncbi:hypothetical protein E1B28_003940 [Marasmius oreades]|uniref:Uncharacterized protein n=1 Tax=Marasmius oreades TaxID=181124 RepID=A0A9P7UXK6_9AGAR|nr:uncharacterized protein E1B28_003940 [Marasmius oreades]KAG7096511.1 hypothetical protein E1B28_003940 [Marasmius oreades]
MYKSFVVLALAAPFAVFAAPINKRQTPSLAATVLKFADVLNQFEAQFYQAAMSKFVDSDYTDAGFVSSRIPLEQFTIIQNDETLHSSFLQSGLAALGESPVTSCKFNLDAATKDVATMTATARVVENLAVSAILGAAPLVGDPVILQAAASILTVEAKHQSMLNVLSSTGSSIPSAFDIPLAPSEVLAIAAPFFDGPCDLGIPAFPTLTITNDGPVTPGTKLTLKSDAINGTICEDELFCQMLLGGFPNSITVPFNNCVVPAGLNGPMAIWVTSDEQPLLFNSVDRQTNNNKLVAGPTMTFVDTQPQTLVQMLRAENAGTVTSKVITGGEASSGSGSGTNSTSSVNNGVTDGGVPVLTTGFSADGKINVLGWNVTDPQGQ